MGRWPELRDRLTAVIGSEPARRWLERAEGRDACVAPVLPMREAADHPQIRARGTVVEVDGVPQPAPAPRFSATPAALDRPPALAGEHTDEVLADCGFSADEVASSERERRARLIRVLCSSSSSSSIRRLRAVRIACDCSRCSFTSCVSQWAK